MKKTLKNIFLDTVPVLTGYLVLGMGFGFTMKASGFGLGIAFAMSLLIYAGAMQYLAIGMLTSGASLLTFAVTTLMVNARHLFYGISMVDRYRESGAAKPYLFLSLTDETYSLVCTVPKELPKEERNRYFLWVSLFDQSYWVAGTLLGALLGTALRINTEGIDFALTALFITVFLQQWLESREHLPAILGVAASVLCLVIFGSENFLIPAMVLIAAALFALRKPEKEVRHE